MKHYQKSLFLTSLIVMLGCSTQSAFAASTIIPQLASAIPILQGFITLIGYVVCLAMIGSLAWEWLGSKHIGRMLAEFIGGIVAVLLAVNGSTIATAIGLSSATITH